MRQKSLRDRKARVTRMRAGGRRNVGRGEIHNGAHVRDSAIGGRDEAPGKRDRRPEYDLRQVMSCVEPAVRRGGFK